MVVALGPGKFYGSSLPRPRIYTDVKLSAERVDPPVPVMDPLMSWAEDAHWSMGGLSFKRHRLQGRIEGNVKKLRAEREKHFKNAEKQKARIDVGGSETKSPSPPPAPLALKRRRRFVGLVDEESDGEEEVEREFKRTARKLGDDFDRVADKKLKTPVKGGATAAEVVGPRTRSRRSEEEIVNEKDVKVKIVKEKNIGDKIGKSSDSKGPRSSPRLAKRD